MSNDQNQNKFALNFIWAAEWDIINPQRHASFKKDYSSISFSERVNMAVIAQLSESNNAGQLKWEPYGPVKDRVKQIMTKDQKGQIEQEDRALYGEYLYFNPIVHELLYNDENDETAEPIHKRYCKRYSYLSSKAAEENESAEYVIWYRYGQQQYIKCTLSIQQFDWMFYSTGIFFFVIDTEGINIEYYKSYGTSIYKEKTSPKQAPYQLFCHAASTGRRIFQPFIDNHGSCSETAFYSYFRFTKPPKEEDERIPVLYNKRQLSKFNDSKDQNTKIEFPQISQSSKWTKPQKCHFLTDLLGNNIMTKVAYEQTEKTEGQVIVLTPFNDDRMYVHGYLTDDSLFSPDSLFAWKTKDGSADSMKRWYAVSYLDRDGDQPCCTDPEMLIEQLKRTTYSRYAGYGTMYALTESTMIMGCQNDSFPPNFTYMQWHYKQMFLLVLLQRCTIIRFADEISQVLENHGVRKKIPDLCSHLQSRYVIYRNSIAISNVTMQMQGQEMYDQLREIMIPSQDQQDLNDALTSLHEYEQELFQSRIADGLSIATMAATIASATMMFPIWEPAEALKASGGTETFILKLLNVLFGNLEGWGSIVRFVIWLVIMLGLGIVGRNLLYKYCSRQKGWKKPIKRRQKHEINGQKRTTKQ